MATNVGHNSTRVCPANMDAKQSSITPLSLPCPGPACLEQGAQVGIRGVGSDDARPRPKCARNRSSVGDRAA
jgi:hypothetical protein